MSFSQRSRVVMGRALMHCVCGESSGRCAVSLSGCVWVPRDRRREGGDACRDHLAGHRPSPAALGSFLPLLPDNSCCLPREEQWSNLETPLPFSRSSWGLCLRSLSSCPGWASPFQSQQAPGPRPQALGWCPPVWELAKEGFHAGLFLAQPCLTLLKPS